MRQPVARRLPGTRSGRPAAILFALVAVVAWLTTGGPSALAGPGKGPVRPIVEFAPDHAGGPVVLAYYYIWYAPRSWDRAKTDLPRLGPYSSKDPAVIAQHVAWAKAAGIDALIVSWKHEPRLDEPLATLVAAAREADLGLVLLYQGLDFSRRPLDSRRIADDLEWFMNEYGDDPVFDVFGAPTIIFSGTPSFSLEQIAAVRQAVLGAGPARLLGSERSGDDYAARRDVLDGDAYYWSSVDPDRDRGYFDRLAALAASIRDDAGLWIAPVAPGFDARLIGGTRVVDRADGATYRTQWTTALSTDPDGLGIISWNEFSENSHIEPSQNYDATYLTATAALGRETLGRQTPIDPAAATARPIEPSPSVAPQVSGAGRNAVVEQLLPLAVAVLLLVSLAALARRPRAPTPPTSAAP
jgi:hypothetical protein